MKIIEVPQFVKHLKPALSSSWTLPGGPGTTSAKFSYVQTVIKSVKATAMSI